MAREDLQALVDDVDRLLAAGSAAAAGDDRLRQRARRLRELGRQVPALAPVAEALDRLCQAESQQASRALLDLVLMARQVRLSLGAGGLEGEVVPLPPSGPWTNNMPTGKLYRLVEAVRGDAANLELLESFAASDLRLLPLLVLPQERRGRVSDQLPLLDQWGEKGNWTALRVLPRLGRGVLPDLERDLDFAQCPGAGRRLAAIGLIDFEAAVQLCLRRLPHEPGALGVLGQLGRPAVEVFVQVLTNPHGNYAKWDLERIVADLLIPFAEDAVPLFRPSLSDPDAARREAAIHFLARFGRAAAPAVADLQDALQDDTASVRQAAARALGKIGAAASAAYPALIARLQDPADEVQQAAAEALKSLGMPRAEVVPLLSKALGHPSEPVRLAVIAALSKAVARNQAARKALITAKKREPRAAVRSAIETALKGIRGKR